VGPVAVVLVLVVFGVLSVSDEPQPLAARAAATSPQLAKRPGLCAPPAYFARGHEMAGRRRATSCDDGG
jgi:hypothetical protein